MKAKERFDGYMRLAELRNSRASNRQNYEWRVTFGLWALITAATVYLKTYRMPLWFGLAVIFVHAFFWLRAVYVAHWNDNEAAASYIEEALSVLEPGYKNLKEVKSELIPVEKLFGFLSEWGSVFQLITTIGFVYFFYLVTNPDALPALLRP